jgi:alkylation response protein AidB-like acyl-CoA dehydrogenase
MNAGLDIDTLGMTLKAVKEFAGEALPESLLLELDEKDEFPVDVVRAPCSATSVSCCCSSRGVRRHWAAAASTSTAICEVMARVDLGVATGVLATFLGSRPDPRWAAPRSSARNWMSRLADEGLIMAYGATEPEAGSDLGSLVKTTAEPLIEDGEITGYRINGTKQWISNGGYADLYTILALAPWRTRPGSSCRAQHGRAGSRPSRRTSTASAPATPPSVQPRRRGGPRLASSSAASKARGWSRPSAYSVSPASWSRPSASARAGRPLDRAIAYSSGPRAGRRTAVRQAGLHAQADRAPPRAPRGRPLRSSKQTAERIDAGEGSLNTEGAIAKYMCSEAGNAAAEAAIQAHGGYGYTREYMVEKIKRDVRITTIYEGTSEILEMTIGRDRWQEHLKTRGQYYRTAAADLEQLHAVSPTIGAGIVALALHALAELMERARLGRLTRNQHVLLRLGELISWAESAASLARRARRAADGDAHSKTDRRFDASALAAISRLFAREAALKIAGDGVRLVAGGSSDEGVVRGLGDAMHLPDIYNAQQGMIADMDYLADVIYGRS